MEETNDIEGKCSAQINGGLVHSYCFPHDTMIKVVDYGKDSKDPEEDYVTRRVVHKGENSYM